MNQLNTHPFYRIHTIDSAMNTLWSYYSKKFLTLFILSFVASLASAYITSFVDLQDIQSTQDPFIMLEKFKGYIIPILLAVVMQLIFTVMLQHYIIFGPLDENNSIYKSAYKSLRYFIPYLIIMILFAFFSMFAMVAGIIVFIIGIFFALFYIAMISMFILPIMMAEGPDIGRTIVRTFKMSHTRFWPNMGWVIVFILLIITFTLVSSAIVALPFTGTFIKSLTNPGMATEVMNYTKSPVYIILASLVSALYFPFMPIFSSILYFNIRAREESVTITTDQEKSEPEKLKVEDLYSKPISENQTDTQENKE